MNAKNKNEESVELQETDTWALAHLARFRDTPQAKWDELLVGLSPQARRIAVLILDPNDRKDVSAAEAATASGFRSWAGEKKRSSASMQRG